MEAYEDVVLDKNIETTPEELSGPIDEIEISDDFNGEDNFEDESHGDEFESEADDETLQDFEKEKNKMVESHLHTIRSHAHEIYGCVERGALIEPWMQEKIAIANDYIIHVANAIMYKK